MNISKSLLATAALVASFGCSVSASAQVTGSLGGPLGSFLSLAGPMSPTDCTFAACTLGSGVGTIDKGRLYSASVSGIAAMPVGTIGNYLSAGTTAGSPATLQLSGLGLADISFLWGSPDGYNSLKVTTTTGFRNFMASAFFNTVNGNQGVASYVTFVADAGQKITKVEFASTQNAFEVSNFSTSVVPEPATYALLASGLVALGLVSKRRKQV